MPANLSSWEYPAFFGPRKGANLPGTPAALGHYARPAALLLDWVRPGALAAGRCNGMGVALGAGLGWRAAQWLAG